MLKHLRESMWLRCLVVLAFVFFVLALHASASEDVEDVLSHPLLCGPIH